LRMLQCITKERSVRILSCFLAIAIAMTVLLSGVEGVQAGSGHGHDNHHGVMIDVSDSSQHDRRDMHADLCGMAVCGPFVKEVEGVLSSSPTVLAVTYWYQDLTLTSAGLDVRAKPPRS
jgi:hypothetical protein